MQCLYPITVPRYSNYKDPRSGIIFTKVYGRIAVPCGRCPACRRRIQNEWAFRCLEEAKSSSKVAFVTLTYSDEFLTLTSDGTPTLNKRQFQRFFKNLRYNFKFRFYGCGEYGDSFSRPHYHFLLFVQDPNITHEYIKECIIQRWPYGFIDYVDTITPANAKYVCKYSMKSLGFDYGECTPPFALMSRRPGIGKSFLSRIDTSLFRKRDLWVVHDHAGTPYPIPRIYKDFFFSKDERDAHNLLLESVINSKHQFDIVDHDNADIGNIYAFEASIPNTIEKRFRQSLKTEFYPFKQLKKNVKKLPVRNSDDFTVNDFM